MLIFSEQVSDHLVHARTYERGVENETKSLRDRERRGGDCYLPQGQPGYKEQNKSQNERSNNRHRNIEVTFDLINGSQCLAQRKRRIL